MFCTVNCILHVYIIYIVIQCNSYLGELEVCAYTGSGGGGTEIKRERDVAVHVIMKLFRSFARGARAHAHAGLYSS